MTDVLIGLPIGIALGVSALFVYRRWTRPLAARCPDCGYRPGERGA